MYTIHSIRDNETAVTYKSNNILCVLLTVLLILMFFSNLLVEQYLVCTINCSVNNGVFRHIEYFLNQDRTVE